MNNNKLYAELIYSDCRFTGSDENIEYYLCFIIYRKCEIEKSNETGVIPKDRNSLQFIPIRNKIQLSLSRLLLLCGPFSFSSWHSIFFCKHLYSFFIFFHILFIYNYKQRQFFQRIYWFPSIQYLRMLTHTYIHSENIQTCKTERYRRDETI